MGQKVDLAVIGAGPGGYVAAIRAAQLGLKTVCIDKSIDPGGTCLNIGCIPSKALLQSTEMYQRIQDAGKENGINFKDISADITQMMSRKNQIVKGLVNGVNQLFKANKVQFLVGSARFKSSHLLEVVNENNVQEIEADNFILATGSESIELKNMPFDEKQILSSTGALSLNHVPKNLVVVGGGAIGLELASVYNRLGSQVTIVEMLDHIALAMDETLCQQLLQILKKQGMKFMLSTTVVSAVVQPNEVILMVNQGDQLQNISCDRVLVAVGRKPYSKGLNLEKIGIKSNAKGFVDVDEQFRTNQSHIFAIGDLIEGPLLAHKASEEGVAVAELLALKKPVIIDYMAIPNVIYTNPEVASVGLTEQECREARLEVVIGRSWFRANPRARCSSETEGLVKIIGEKASGRLVGLHILGPHASELIEEGMIAIGKRATLQDIAYAAHAHPTLSEAIKEAALAAC